MIDDVEALGAVGIVDAGQIDELAESQIGVVAQVGQQVHDAVTCGLQRQLAISDLESGDRAAGGGLDPLAEPGQILVRDGVAHRSIVPVRRIFFCSCSTP